MSEFFRDPAAGWAAILVVLLPLAIIGIGELEERLRQVDSPLRRATRILRVWVVPLFAAWALARVLFALGGTHPAMRLLASALIVGLSAAALATLTVVVTGSRDRQLTGGRRSVPRLLLALPRLLILLATIWVLVAGVWSVDLSAALTALGVTSLIISFALQDTLGGIASGFTLLADQPFKAGDWIRTGDIEGRVVDVNWRSSRIQTRSGDLVIVPNGQLANATITNFDEPSRHHRVVVSLQVAFSNAPTRVAEMLTAAATATNGVLSEPPPSVRLVTIDDPLMGYEVHLWIDDYSIMPQVKSDFGALVWYHSHRYDVPLPSPAQDLYLWDGDRVLAEGRRDHASLARALRGSPLLGELGPDEIDRLADGARSCRFARDEVVVVDRDLGPVLIEQGRARLVVRTAAGDHVPVLDLAAGDVLGLLEPESPDRLRVIAITDCDVVQLDAAAARDVISRSPALGTALEQVAASRRRRVQRVIQRIEHGS